MDVVHSTDVELVCKCLQVEHKTFYFDLKENPRGRYLKISEKSSGSRSTIIVPVAGIVWFVDLFSYYADGDDREPSSKELQLDNKVFHFEVRENAKGRFLKVSEVSLPSIRSTIIVPAGNEADEGWGAFRNVLAEIHETSQLIVTLPDGSVSSQLSGTPELLGNLSDVVDTAAYMSSRNGKLVSQARPLRDGATNLLPSINHDTGGLITARVLRAKNKKFYFDLGSNARGQYLRISEVVPYCSIYCQHSL
ncbi:hypothetical protein O6H91_16G035700 [Diphasiastrum complanatum]|uniref:Uncharacterized protein n=1 Tax=Diphasiastrum complanatum TaxID=34168 RepID=A0ACC2BBG6_DIPCM|nr:hypothetical protein O6H91_16G035700 [Diphasiastrum complanatum]